MSIYYLDAGQCELLRRTVSDYERARVFRCRWASYGALAPAQVQALLRNSRGGAFALRDELLVVEGATKGARDIVVDRAAAVAADRVRAEEVQRAGVGSLPGSVLFSRALAAAKELPALIEMQDGLAEALSREWPSDEALRAGVAAVAKEVLFSLRQAAAAEIYAKLLPARQAVEMVLRIVEHYTQTSRAFASAACGDLGVDGWHPADVEALRAVARLEFIRTTEKEKS